MKRPRRRQPRLSLERRVLWGMLVLALLGAGLGLTVTPSATVEPGVRQQVLDVVRVIATTALAIVLTLGPGLLWRARTGRRTALGYLPLPGFALLVGVGCLAWALGSEISPRLVCASLLIPALGVIAGGLASAGSADLLQAPERRALIITGCGLGLGVARSLWSLGPVGELAAHGISRTLEVGDRPDSSISYSVVQLLAHGVSPFSAAGRAMFAPLSFSDRGPLAGTASAPVVLLSGGRPPTGALFAPWLPFDPQGFMAYRLAMMAFASSAFLSLWTLARRLGGDRAAQMAVLLGASTPFLIHEVWFTWPKLFAASLVLLAAHSLIDDRPLRAGLLLSVGYLVHPGVLLSVPALVLLALWPLRGAQLRRPLIRPALLLIGGVATGLIAWRLVNGSHYTQSNFLSYLTEAGRKKYLAQQFLSAARVHPTATLKALAQGLLRAVGGHPRVTVGDWLTDRFVSVSNTLVPFRLFLVSAHDQSINVINGACYPLCSGNSPAIVHFFFQYWTTLPFGVGILFFPILLPALWRAHRLWRWGVFVAVLVPFVVFAVYWGDASTGLLREGLHVWVLTLLIVVALEQRAAHFSWLRSGFTRAVLALRPLEVLLVAVLPTLVTTHRVYDARYAVSDISALLVMLGLCGYLGLSVWRARPFRSGHPDQLGQRPNGDPSSAEADGRRVRAHWPG